jgi:periplasmic protein TonB
VSPRSRVVSLLLAALPYAAFVVLLALKFGEVAFVAPASAPLLVTFETEAAPPEPVREVPEGPAQIEQQQAEAEAKREPDTPEPAPRETTMLDVSQVPISADQPAPEKAQAAAAAVAVRETSAPKSVPAPPSRRLASTAEATWEAQVLARLEAFRKYPASAQARRVEGVAVVHFTMGRNGVLIATSLRHSAGSAILDRAALETVRRASPFPPPPEERPGNPIALDVPVEFFLQ